ncbi:MAG: glutamine-hydrolyzing GMP synthase [Candidatus Bathyarchaeia archaeon]
MEIAILDFGGQYVFNIRRGLLEQGVAAEILPHDTPAEKLKKSGAKGVILSGGPYSVCDSKAPLCDPLLFKSNLPVLGLCYGHQLIAHLLGGEVGRGKAGEYGFSEVTLDTSNSLFRGLSPREICWMSHGDIVKKIPPGFQVIGSTAESEVAAYHSKERIFGLQFHPEVSHTPHGHKILRNFAEICRCRLTGWDVRCFIWDSVAKLKESVRDGKAIIAVSGGVDSTTAALLAHHALGGRLICAHIDHGLMRKGESENVTRLLKSLGLNIVFTDASQRFLEALKGVERSDEKRRVIGRLFIEEFERIAEQHKIGWLIQGTIAPDVIESTRGLSSRRTDRGHGGLIKIHHNVAGLPKGMKLQLIEPLSSLFKYQVRTLARQLNLPAEISERQPFPGPGLACRIAGEVNGPKLEVLRDIDAKVENELKRYNPSQYFAILINNVVAGRCQAAERIASKYLGKSVDAFLLQDECIGVKGDERAIGKMVMISTPAGGRLAWEKCSFLDMLRMQNEITGSVKEVCRVSILLTSPYAPGSGFGIVIRAVDTIDFMTAIPSNIDFTHLAEIGRAVMADHQEIRFVGYEITTKPAATIELI